MNKRWLGPVLVLASMLVVGCSSSDDETNAGIQSGTLLRAVQCRLMHLLLMFQSAVRLW